MISPFINRMTGENFIVIGILCIFILSGLIINLWKKLPVEDIKIKNDANTLLYFRLIIPGALISSIVLYFSGIGNYQKLQAVTNIGYLLVTIGFTLRWIAVVSLGKSFTVKVIIHKNHKLKIDGVYQWIRHPSYTGLILYYLGSGLIMHNWLSLCLLTILPVFVVLLRIKPEETMLSSHFRDGYEIYQSKSWKLFPFIY